MKKYYYKCLILLIFIEFSSFSAIEDLKSRILTVLTASRRKGLPEDVSKEIIAHYLVAYANDLVDPDNFRNTPFDAQAMRQGTSKLNEEKIRLIKNFIIANPAYAQTIIPRLNLYPYNILKTQLEPNFELIPEIKQTYEDIDFKILEQLMAAELENKSEEEIEALYREAEELGKLPQDELEKITREFESGMKERMGGFYTGLK